MTRAAATCLAAAALAAAACGERGEERRAEAESRRSRPEQTLSNWHPTPDEAAHAALTLAGAGASDVVYDAGSGKGDVLLVAAGEYEARAVGIEIVAELAEESRRRAAEAGLADRIEVRTGDALEADYSDATVVFTYQTTEGMRRLSPVLLERLKPGTRVVSHGAPLTGLSPAADPVVLRSGGTQPETHVLTLFVIPGATEGEAAKPGGGAEKR